MSGTEISVLINEQAQTAREGVTVGELRDRFKPGADVLVLNGFPCSADAKVGPGDRVALIRRGEIPAAEEMEALMVARHTPQVYDRMKRAVVGVAGLGGLGSNVAISLARMGIGALILADFDVVEPSNLNRQQYSVQHLGMMKTDAMSRILESINPYLRVDTHEIVLDEGNIGKIFRNAEVVVECFDGAEAKAMFVHAAAESLPEAYIVAASGLAGYGDSNSVRTIQLGHRIYMVGDLIRAAEPGRGLMAPRVAIAAGHQANLVVSLLMDPQNVRP